MEAESGGVAHGQHERRVIGGVQAVKGIDVEPVLNENLREALDAVCLRATLQSVGRRVRHVGRGIGHIEALAVPARWKRDGHGQSVRAGGKALGDPLGVIVWVLRRTIAVASPTQLATVGTHGDRIVLAHGHVTCDHSELRWKLLDIPIILVCAVAVLVVYLVVRLLRDPDKRSVVWVMKVQIRHL